MKFDKCKGERMKKLLFDSNTGEDCRWAGTEEQLNEFLKLYPEICIIEEAKPLATSIKPPRVTMEDVCE